MITIWGTILVLAFIAYILLLIAKKEIELKNVISWLFLSVLTFPIIWIPNILKFFSKILGIQVPSNLLFFLGICFLIYLNFSLTRLVSKQSVQIRLLTQKIALSNKENEK